MLILNYVSLNSASSYKLPTGTFRCPQARISQIISDGGGAIPECKDWSVLIDVGNDYATFRIAYDSIATVSCALAWTDDHAAELWDGFVDAYVLGLADWHRAQKKAIPARPATTPWVVEAVLATAMMSPRKDLVRMPTIIGELAFGIVEKHGLALVH